jgi:hypothetical protein
VKRKILLISVFVIAALLLLSASHSLGMQAGAVFAVTPTLFTDVTTASSFKQGDMIFFDIKTNDQAVTSVKVMIKDPTGTYWWGTPDLAITWPVVFDAEGHGYTPFALQLAYGLDNMNLILPANAPVGAWTWTITLPSAATTLPLIRSGIFEVTSSAPTPTPTPTSTATSTPTSSPTLPPTPTPTLTPTATHQPTSSLPTVYLVAIIVIAVVIAIVIAVFVLKKRSHTQPPPPPPKLNSPGRTL